LNEFVDRRDECRKAVNRKHPNGCMTEQSFVLGVLFNRAETGPKTFHTPTDETATTEIQSELFCIWKGERAHKKPPHGLLAIVFVVGRQPMQEVLFSERKHRMNQCIFRDIW